MKRIRMVVLALALIACRSDPAPPAPDTAAHSAPAGSASTSAPKGVSDFPEDPDAPQPAKVLAPAPSGSAVSRVEREKAVLDLLAGKLPAKDVADAPTDPGKEMDPWLREVLSRPPRPSKVEIRSVEAKGLDGAAARRAVSEQMSLLKACHRRGLANNPYLQGRVAVRLAIGAGGKATSAENVGSDVPDSAVIRCVQDRLREAAMPEPQAAPGSVTVTVVLSILDGG
ncbi:MAG: AgmX/PglI C-terminal domain-containing protein [Minicystis sp.]